jgi:signal transduction histidine kinase
MASPAGATMRSGGGSLSAPQDAGVQGSQHPGRELVHLADRIGRHAGDRTRSLRAITETAARLLGVQRAGIWLYAEDRTRLECVDLHEVEASSHTRGPKLDADRYPAYFRAMEEARIIDAHDAVRDPRTREFAASYLEPLGIGAMLDAPIRARGRMIGVVCHEHLGPPRQWTTEEKSLAATMADVVALRIESSERARSDEERQKIEVRLARAQKMEALGRLAGGIAHDFNNLLTAVEGSLELLRYEIARDSLDRDFLLRELENIGLAADRAARLTRQLSGFSRSEVTHTTRIHPPTVLGRIRELLERLVSADIRLLLEPDPETPWVDMDPSQFEQVVLNLATNSADAMGSGGTLTIRTAGITAPEGEHRFELTVTDTGIGIAPEVLPLIFEPFYSTKEVGVGWGLGLATVQGIVERSQGEILVRSETGRGTTFRILLPAAEPPADADVEPGQDAAATACGGQETILLCEDDERIREHLSATLARHGYEVLVAGDGETAEAMAEKFGGRIDLLLTDVVMPGTSGPALASTLRRLRPGIRVLFVSGYTADALNRSGLDAQDEIFLAKPFRPSDVVCKVREVLDS